MGVLPDRLHNYQARSGRNSPENLHTVLLAVDETVLLGRVVGMGAADILAGRPNGRHHCGFDTLLRRPTLSVGGKPQIPIRDYNDRIGHLFTLLHVARLWQAASFMTRCMRALALSFVASYVMLREQTFLQQLPGR